VIHRLYIITAAEDSSSRMQDSPTNESSFIVADVERWKLDGDAGCFSSCNESVLRLHSERNKRRHLWSQHTRNSTSPRLSLACWYWHIIIITRHNISRSRYNTPQYGRNGTASLQITSRTQQVRRFYRWRGESSPACVVHAACGGPGRLPLGSATHF